MKEKTINSIKNPYMAGLISKAKRLIKGLLKCLPDSIFLRLRYRSRMGKKLNIKNPETFNEKIQWLKLYDRKPLYTQLTDKYAVRQYITEKIGGEYLIPLFGVWDKFDDIDFPKLPDQFVLQCNHDCGSIIICKDKSTFDIKEAKKKLNKCLKKNYYWEGREWNYKNIKPKIMALKYLEDEFGELRDYKFFCFNGIPKILFISTDRQIHETKFDFFDINFNRLKLQQHYPNNQSYEFSKPKNFKLFIQLAQRLSSGIPHCRVDFYSINGQIYFGEITFHHFGGATKFTPESYDYLLGSYITLPAKETGKT